MDSKIFGKIGESLLTSILHSATASVVQVLGEIECFILLKFSCYDLTATSVRKIWCSFFMQGDGKLFRHVDKVSTILLLPEFPGRSDKTIFIIDLISCWNFLCFANFNQDGSEILLPEGLQYVFCWSQIRFALYRQAESIGRQTKPIYWSREWEIYRRSSVSTTRRDRGICISDGKNWLYFCAAHSACILLTIFVLLHTFSYIYIFIS